MLINSKYYIYRHIRTDTNMPFYIGKGVAKNGYGCRLTDFKGRSKLWKKIYAKCNEEILVEVIYESDSHEKIVEKETEFIFMYGRIDLGTGTLANLTDGGEGVVGRIASRETIEKFKKTVKTSRTWEPHSEETKRRMSESHKRYFIENKEKLQKKFSERAKRNWLNPTYRETITEAIRVRMNSPEVKAKVKPKLEKRDKSKYHIRQRQLKMNKEISFDGVLPKHTTPHTEEVREKISAKLKGNYFRDTKIEIQYNGSFEVFNSIEDASKMYKISYRKLSEIIKSGTVWQGISAKRFKKTEEEIAKMLLYVKSKAIQARSKGNVFLYTNGVYIGKFPSENAIATYLNIHPSLISKAFNKSGDKKGTFKQYKFIKE